MDQRTYNRGDEQVTEADLIQTFLYYTELLDAEILAFISVLSGFIVVSYLVADRLTAALATIVVTLYTLACGIFIVRMIFLRRDFSALHSHIVELQASGSIEMPWFGSNPPWGSEVISGLIWAVSVGGYAGSVLFFFVQRNARRSRT
jgi:hypothetical protein